MARTSTGQHVDYAGISLDLLMVRLREAYQCAVEAKTEIDASKRLLGTMPQETKAARSVKQAA